MGRMQNPLATKQGNVQLKEIPFIFTSDYSVVLQQFFTLMPVKMKKREAVGRIGDYSRLGWTMGYFKFIATRIIYTIGK